MTITITSAVQGCRYFLQSSYYSQKLFTFPSFDLLPNSPSADGTELSFNLVLKLKSSSQLQHCLSLYLQLNSEYNSRYKTFAVHRPVTTKAKIVSQPLDSAPEALESSRRAGLLSNQFSNVTEPALQRKRIVPYKHNHNILSTSTVKELNDKDWLEAVENDADEQTSTTSNVKRKDVKKTEYTEYSSSFAKQTVKEDSPVILASKAKMEQKSQGQKRQTRRSAAPPTTSLEKSPERMPPAGVPTYVADPQDKRLLRPSDDLLYPETFQENNRNSQTEYSERYKSSAEGRKNGTSVPKIQETSNIDLATYKKILLQRNDAYNLSVRPSTSPVKEQSSSRNSTPKLRQPRGARKSGLDSKSSSSYISEGREKELRETYTIPERKHKDDKLMSKTRERTKATQRRADEESLSSIRSARDLEAKRKLKKEVKHTAYEVQQSEDKHFYAESVSSCNSQSTNNEGYHIKEKLIPAYTRSKSAKNLNKGEKSKQIQSEKRSSSIKNKTRGEQDQLVTKGDARGSARINRDTEKIRKDILERGRSPTPEMRTAGQSRRHHLDITTGSNNPLATGLRSMKYERASYDPSRYSDAGDSLVSSRSLASWSDRGS